MTILSYDSFRCKGIGCALADTCLRHIAMNDMGPRTAFMKCACEAGEHFIDAIFEAEERYIACIAKQPNPEIHPPWEELGEETQRIWITGKFPEDKS